jgi:uncharacterized protein YbaR (Trm112 family)
MVDPELLKLLCCPETHQPVRPAEAPLVDELNAKIRDSGLCTRGGRTISEKIDEGLIRADGKVLFPIRNGIPVMLVEESICVG